MRTLLLDSHNLIMRSYYALPMAYDQQQRPNNAIRGWYATWLKLTRVLKPDTIIAVFDGGISFERVLLHPEYKTGREEKPDTLKTQIQAIYKSAPLAGITTVLLPEVEADDLIYTLAQDNSSETFIISDDKDLAQCVNDSKNVAIYRPSSDHIWREKDVHDNFGVHPSQIDSFLALCGDSVDRIPGVPTIGKVTAAKLLSKYPDIHTALRTDPKYAARYSDFYKPLADTMLALTQLKVIDIPPGTIVHQPADHAGLYQLLLSHNLYRIATELNRQTSRFDPDWQPIAM